MIDLHNKGEAGIADLQNHQFRAKSSFKIVTDQDEHCRDPSPGSALQKCKRHGPCPNCLFLTQT